MAICVTSSLSFTRQEGCWLPFLDLLYINDLILELEKSPCGLSTGNINISHVATQNKFTDVVKRSKQEVLIRRATLYDKAAVLGIPMDMEGPDCLPSYYDKILTHPNSKSYVAVAGDRIVTFSSGFVVDRGQTFVSRLSRTCPDMRRKNLVSACIAHGVATSTRLRFAVISSSPTFHHPDRQIIAAKPLLLFRIRAADFYKSYYQPPKSLENTDVCRLMEDTFLRRYLFPEGLITVDWVPFDVQPSNISLFRGVGGFGSMFADVQSNAELQSSGLFSISSWFSFCHLACCTIDIYGTDMTSLIQHIAWHIVKKKTISIDSQISLLLVLPATVDPLTVERLMCKLGYSTLKIADDVSGKQMQYICTVPEGYIRKLRTNFLKH